MCVVQATWTFDDCDDDALEGAPDAWTPAGTVAASPPAAVGAVGAAAGGPDQKGATPFVNLFCKYPTYLPNKWSQLTTERAYTPGADDVGRALRFEVVPVIGGSAAELLTGSRNSIDTQPTMPAPPPSQQRTAIAVTSPDVVHHLAQSPFRVTCYNILADIYANRQIYPYTTHFFQQKKKYFYMLFPNSTFFV